MKQEEILKSNKLIAEFMGATKCELFIKSIGDVIGYENEEYKLPIDELEYHSSWSWLMPVVDKIESLEYQVNINGNDCYVLQPNTKGKLVVHCHNWSNKLECVYEAVISTIKWYNTQNK